MQVQILSCSPNHLISATLTAALSLHFFLTLCLLFSSCCQVGCSFLANDHHLHCDLVRSTTADELVTSDSESSFLNGYFRVVFDVTQGRVLLYDTGRANAIYVE